MQHLTLPELVIVFLLFLVTLLICYCIWYLLFGKKLPLKDNKSREKKIENCTLNEIMGYEFIQIKNIKQTTKKEIAVIEEDNTTEDSTTPVLYATSNNNDYNEIQDWSGENNQSSDTELAQSQPPFVNISDEDFDEIADQPWDNISPEDFEETIQGYQNIYDNDDTQSENLLTDEQTEQEQTFEEYQNQMYEAYAAFELNDADIAAIQHMREVTSESYMSDSNNNENED